MVVVLVVKSGRGNWTWNDRGRLLFIEVFMIEICGE